MMLSLLDRIVPEPEISTLCYKFLNSYSLDRHEALLGFKKQEIRERATVTLHKAYPCLGE